MGMKKLENRRPVGRITCGNRVDKPGDIHLNEGDTVKVEWVGTRRQYSEAFGEDFTQLLFRVGGRILWMGSSFQLAGCVEHLEHGTKLVICYKGEVYGPNGNPMHDFDVFEETPDEDAPAKTPGTPAKVAGGPRFASTAPAVAEDPPPPGDGDAPQEEPQAARTRKK